ncbi:MAG: malto-oligosyltrehalose synthase [Terracoccus sp.]
MSYRRVPVSTHRLQLEPDFTLDDAREQVDHLSALGVSHLYLSPVLQATPGSNHGYDVTDHTKVSAGLGGDEALDRLAVAARAAGLGIVLDVVPNHMTTPTPLTLNAPLWAVLREGRDSSHASWFDVDWDAQGGRILMPVLGSDLEEVLAAGEISLGTEGGETVVRYYDHVFPVADGTGGMPLAELLEAQHYRLASWKVGATDLNYRRFFDVTSLIAIRVELQEVFDATHERIVELIRSGDADGLRIDHPDGLADPRGYLRMLATATDDAWVVVEKILEGDEQLPADWVCAGTTGYDAMLRIGGLFVDPDGEAPLTALSDELLGRSQDLEGIVVEAKHFVAEKLEGAEVNRLLRVLTQVLPSEDPARLRRVIVALLVGMERYRSYVVPGDDMSQDSRHALDEAREHAAGALEAEDAEAVELVADLATGDALQTDRPAGDGPGWDEATRAAAADFVVRFQQTCGPVMAKSIEDTAYYRYVRLTGLNEVGGDPSRVGIPTAEFHRFAEGIAADWPHTMTTLSTHDTKRAEDVRARLFVLSERPAAWQEWLTTAREIASAHRGERLDALTEYFLWQTVVGAWPIDAERLGGYALKAIRESKLFTMWSEPDEDYEAAVATFVDGVVSDPAVTAHLDAWHTATAVETRANVLGQKLVQLMMPGIPDVYQGTDVIDLSLVDPDNRRLVDYASRRDRLARLDRGGAPSDLDDEKLLVTSRALRVRSDRVEAVIGTGTAHLPLASDSDHLVAFGRGSADSPDLVVLATRLAGRLADDGGWGDATVTLPEGRWRDVLTSSSAATTTDGGAVRVSDVLGSLPVALLVRDGETA